jgi:hypothetical protein
MEKPKEWDESHSVEAGDAAKKRPEKKRFEWGTFLSFLTCGYR